MERVGGSLSCRNNFKDTFKGIPELMKIEIICKDCYLIERYRIGQGSLKEDDR